MPKIPEWTSGFFDIQQQEAETDANAFAVFVFIVFPPV